jgi:capsular polysaccharide biosynthesis protein
MFTGQSQVFVSVRGTDGVGEMGQAVTWATRAVRSYVQLATTPVVLQPVIEELGLVDTATSLAERVSASNPLDTQLLNISVSDRSPELAASIANAVARSLAREVEVLETPSGGGDSNVRIATVRSALAPDSPSSPNTRMNLALGLLGGLALGVALE